MRRQRGEGAADVVGGERMGGVAQSRPPPWPMGSLDASAAAAGGVGMGNLGVEVAE